MYSVRSNVSLKICLFCLGLGIKPGMSIMSIAFKGNLRLIVYSIVRQRKTNLLLLYFDFSALTVCSDGSAMDRYFLFSLSFKRRVTNDKCLWRSTLEPTEDCFESLNNAGRRLFISYHRRQINVRVYSQLWNKTLWLVAASHVTFVDQSDCIISEYAIHTVVIIILG